jgi:DNA-binding NtrC family response regulator
VGRRSQSTLNGDEDTWVMTRQVGRFEVADGSTLFRGEVGELSVEIQTSKPMLRDPWAFHPRRN